MIFANLILILKSFQKSSTKPFANVKSDSYPLIERDRTPYNGEPFSYFRLALSEVDKLQRHLLLLKEEYTKLQSHCADLERKYSLAAASAGDLSESSFVARLLMTVATLYGRELYSDVSVKLVGRHIPAHKFVLNARSDDFNEDALKNTQELGILYKVILFILLLINKKLVTDWSVMPEAVGESMLKWIYTDIVEFTRGDEFATQLMKQASLYKLPGLVRKCENALISVVNVRCVLHS